ncbi:MAG: DUF6477 family protein [Hasllibacter sp.]
MLDLATRLRMLDRPALLVRTARHGLDDYRRERDLKRLLRLGNARVPGPGAAAMALLQKEDALDRMRRNGDPRYTHQAHVGMLIGLMAEARTVLARSPRHEP